MRSIQRSSTENTRRAITPTMGEAYASFVKKEGFPPQKIELEDGTKAYWLGSPDAEKIIIWCHGIPPPFHQTEPKLTLSGGGYNVPPDAGHLSFASSLTSTTPPRTSVLMLEYSLAPYDTYPTQLREAVSLLSHLIHNLSYSPSRISLAGDSAGANLTLGILSHILHPHPEITPLKLEQPLAAAILLAPWASFATDWPSNARNADKDIVSSYAGNSWSTAFLGGAPGDAYNEPLTAKPGWWEGLDNAVNEILITGGSDEVLVDCIRELSKILEGVHGKVTTVIAEGEWHDKPVLSMLGGGGEQADAIQGFVRSRL